MENNVLGLKVTRTKEGYTELLNLNGQEYWSKHTRDLRPELDNIANFGNGTSVLMLDRTESSWLLSVIIPIPGRGGDNVCAWINVPCNLNISGQELEAVVEAVRKELMKNMRDDYALKELFSKQYDTDSVKRPKFESSGDKVAYRLYGQGTDYSLDELLGKMDQPCYRGYKCVYFIDADSSAKIKIGDNLSDKKLLSQFRIGPLRANGDGFEPYFQGMPFTNPVYVTEGETIEIVWKHKDKKYANIVHRHPIGHIKPELDYPEFSEYERFISYDDFTIQDEEGKYVPEYRLNINGTELLKGHKIQVSESKVHECKVKVIAEGYEECDESKDLSRQCTISLKKKYYNYRLVVPAEHKDIEIVYKSDRPLKQSPLKGYALTSKKLSTDHPNRLRYSPYDKKFRRTALIAAAIVLCVGILIGVSLPDMSSSKKTKQEQEVATENNRKFDRGVHNVATDRSDEVPNESDTYVTPLLGTDKGSSSGKSSVKEIEEDPKGLTDEHETGRDKKKSDSDKKNQRMNQDENSEDTKRGNDLFNFDLR